MRCFTYGENRHRQTTCSNQGCRGLLANDVPYDDELVYDEKFPEDFVENEVIGDSRHFLVLHGNYLAPQKQTEDWRRRSIFQSTCTINNKVCHFAIDFGSCATIISREAMRKLNLPT